MGERKRAHLYQALVLVLYCSSATIVWPRRRSLAKAGHIASLEIAHGTDRKMFQVLRQAMEMLKDESYVESYTNGGFDGQGSGHDFYGTVWMPPHGWINNCDGGRSVHTCDYHEHLKNSTLFPAEALEGKYGGEVLYSDFLGNVFVNTLWFHGWVGKSYDASNDKGNIAMIYRLFPAVDHLRLYPDPSGRQKDQVLSVMAMFGQPLVAFSSFRQPLS